MLVFLMTRLNSFYQMLLSWQPLDAIEKKTYLTSQGIKVFTMKVIVLVNLNAGACTVFNFLCETCLTHTLLTDWLLNISLVMISCIPTGNFL